MASRGKSIGKTIASAGGKEDIIRLKRIARKMVEQLEEAIEQCGAVSAGDSKKQKSDSLFTGKNSLITALITLTDLLLTLESSAPQNDEISKEDELALLSLSKADRELLRHFVEKQQAQEP